MSNNEVTQRVSSGERSSNYLAARDITIVNGMDAAAVVRLCREFMASEFEHYKSVARELVEKRSTEILEEFASKLQSSKVSTRRLGDPRVQYSIYTAQREYAKSGDHCQRNILTELLLDQMKAGTSTIQELVTSQAIDLLPRLTQMQIAYLAIATTVLSLTAQGQTKEAVAEHIEETIVPIHEKIRVQFYDLRHLESCGALKLNPFQNSVATALASRNPIFKDAPKIEEWLAGRSVGKIFKDLRLGTITLSPVGECLAFEYLKLNSGITLDIENWLNL